MRHHAVRGACCLLLGMMPVIIAGCSDPEPPPPKREVKSAPVAPPPSFNCDLDQLREELEITDRVRLSQAEAPPNCQERRDVFSFFDAFIEADADTLRGYMASDDSLQLEAMINAGHFDDSVERVRNVTLQTGVSPEGRHCILAIYRLNEGGYEAQLWYYDQGQGGSNGVFSAASQPPDIMNKLSGIDLVESWFKVLQAEAEIWQEYDYEIDDISEDVEAPSPSSNRGSGGTLPSGPIGPGSPGRSPGGPGPGGPG
jgi:hypothetical protein